MHARIAPVLRLVVLMELVLKDTSSITKTKADPSASSLPLRAQQLN
jgi:hypothetical protein